MKRTVRKIGEFSVGSFGIYPLGRNKLMTLWAIEPDHTQHAKECYPSLPTNKYLYPSRSKARAAARSLRWEK